jgi:hypothetical protein
LEEEEDERNPMCLFHYLMCILIFYNTTFNLIMEHPKCADHHKCAHINNDFDHEMCCPFSMCRANFYAQQGHISKGLAPTTNSRREQPTAHISATGYIGTRTTVSGG